MACRQQSRHQVIVPRDIAAGAIVIEVSISQTGADKYWQYQVVPSVGRIREVKSGTRVRGSLEDAAAYIPRPDCFRGKTAISPDQRFLARCSDEFGGKRANFRIRVAQTQEEVFDWNPAGWRGIDGFIWSANSRSVAVFESLRATGSRSHRTLMGGCRSSRPA